MQIGMEVRLEFLKLCLFTILKLQLLLSWMSDFKLQVTRILIINCYFLLYNDQG